MSSSTTINLIASLALQEGEFIYDELNHGSFHHAQPHAGSMWISILEGNYGKWQGQVVSCYYHPTKDHTATTIGKLGTKRSEAPAGVWAVSFQPKSMYGNRCHYNTLGL